MNTGQRSSCLILLLVGLVCAFTETMRVALAEQPAASRQLEIAAATHPLATVLGRPICQTDIPDRQSLNGVIVRRLMEHYMAVKCATPTDEEVDGFLSFRPPRPDTVTADVVRSETYQRIRREQAVGWASMWKLNKALYEQYGGKVIWQQAGLEPVEAYRTWMEENHRNGLFTIHDASREAEFWSMFKMDGIAVRPAAIVEYFAQPWWMRAQEALSLRKPPAGNGEP